MLLPWVREPVLLYTPTPYRGGPPSPHAPIPHTLLYSLGIHMYIDDAPVGGVGREMVVGRGVGGVGVQ